MKTKLILILLASALLRYPLSADEEKHVDVSGVVTSAMDHKPLDKVAIQAQPKQKKVPIAPAITDGSGHYKTSVPAGETILLFVPCSKCDYRPARFPLNTTSATITVDEELYPKNTVSQEYWAQKAKEVATFDPEAIRGFWSGLELKQVNALEKVWFAQALLNDNVEVAKQLPEVKTFADADPDVLVGLSKSVDEWLYTKDGSPQIVVGAVKFNKLPEPIMANVIGEAMAKGQNFTILFDKVDDKIGEANPQLASLAAAGAATQIVTGKVASGKPQAVKKAVEWLRQGDRATTDVYGIKPHDLVAKYGSLDQIKESIAWASKLPD